MTETAHRTERLSAETPMFLPCTQNRMQSRSLLIAFQIQFPCLLHVDWHGTHTVLIPQFDIAPIKCGACEKKYVIFVTLTFDLLTV